jgi:hypothetical protein
MRELMIKSIIGIAIMLAISTPLAAGSIDPCKLPPQTRPLNCLDGMVLAECIGKDIA